ncbi:hypothetical protein [Pseudomonas lurida]|uniref:hypothetical protein n=1 Tax=Pseudomonas lurida TaxID=244566 RepID=UPI001F485EBF|nr:hypothetical protein [Pseudomonas lurida]MCF5025120.1 hypothetical protein [Pseudomonas lurida]MCF5308297.1 hypothetical protein [Pseudomonas lurida]MCF5324677.1 hypothetical protein [Pseudomonas lurida]
MKLKVDSINNRGNLNQEHVSLKVLANCNLSYYMVMDTTYGSEGGISNAHRHVKWLPQYDVTAGMMVALWTGKGVDRIEVHDGLKWQYVYWNSGTHIWNNDGDAAVLLELSSWETTPVK